MQGKRGPEEPQDHALGRSRGGLTTKIHMLCDANGVPLNFLLSGGQIIFSGLAFNFFVERLNLMIQVNYSGHIARAAAF